jgi:hypothetical protein
MYVFLNTRIQNNTSMYVLFEYEYSKPKNESLCDNKQSM